MNYQNGNMGINRNLKLGIILISLSYPFNFVIDFFPQMVKVIIENVKMK
jgi:hypothetical protein